MIKKRIQHKIRIVQHSDKTTTWGCTIPVEFSNMFNVYVTIAQSGNSLILTSGARPTSLETNEIKKIGTVVEKINI